MDQGERVRLAREKPLRLGAVQVRPATREVIGPRGREVLEPRVMQVLVALARAGGEIVTRDDLIESCWDGRIVGEDVAGKFCRRGVQADRQACVARIVRTSVSGPSQDALRLALEERAATRLAAAG